MPRKPSRKPDVPNEHYTPTANTPEWFYERECTHLVLVMTCEEGDSGRLWGVVTGKATSGYFGHCSDQSGFPDPLDVMDSLGFIDQYTETHEVRVLLIDGRTITTFPNQISRVRHLDPYYARTLVKKIWHDPVKRMVPSRFFPPWYSVVVGVGDHVKVVNRDIPEYGMIGKVVKLDQIRTREQWEAAPACGRRYVDNTFVDFKGELTMLQFIRVAVRLPGEAYLEVDLPFLNRDLSDHRISSHIELFHSVAFDKIRQRLISTL